MLPLAGGHVGQCVWGIRQRIVLLVQLAFLYRLDFLLDGNQCIAETIQFEQRQEYGP